MCLIDRSTDTVFDCTINTALQRNLRYLGPRRRLGQKIEYSLRPTLKDIIPHALELQILTQNIGRSYRLAILLFTTIHVLLDWNPRFPDEGFNKKRCKYL